MKHILSLLIIAAILWSVSFPPAVAKADPLRAGIAKADANTLNDKLQVRVGEDRMIIPLHKNPCPIVHMIKLGNGDVVVNTLLTTRYGAVVTGKRSRDSGQSWEDATCMWSKDGGKT